VSFLRTLIAVPNHRRSAPGVSEFAFASDAASPRKRPVQHRSRDTVQAILDATFRVLAADGDALTTTQVAGVAGVSIGTLYQYFPNRDALLIAAFGSHLEAAIEALEDSTGEALERGLALDAAVEHVVRAFLAVKAERAAAARAFNRVFGTGKLDDRPMVKAAGERAHVTIAHLLAGGGAPSATLDQRARLACSALEGVVRAAVDDDPERLRDPAWTEQVVQLAVAAVRVM
jgi:AcrR family transcriptional regulator